VIQTLEDLAEASRLEVESMPADVREDLRARLLIRRAAGSETVDRLRDRWPSLPDSFLQVVREWDVLGRSFTGFVDLARVDHIGDAAAAEAFGLDSGEFVSFASNGSGDPFGVAPDSARLNPRGSILHLNHDTGNFAVVAPDLSSFLIGLGNYGECWDAESDAPEELAGPRLQERLEALGWPAEFRRYWPGINENGAFD
jgi:hypothetical protein